MALPQVSLSSGKVSWTPPTTDNTGAALVPADTPTGYVVGLRSLTAVGSAAGTYPIQSPPTAATAVSEALAAINATLKPDDYAASVQAQSANGPSDWASEFQFTGVLPVPNAPTNVSVS